MRGVTLDAPLWSWLAHPGAGSTGRQSAIVNRELERMGSVGLAWVTWGRVGCGVGVRHEVVPIDNRCAGAVPVSLPHGRIYGWPLLPEEVPIPARQSRSDWRAHWQGGSEGTGELAGRYLASRQILKQLCRQLEPPVGSYGSDSWHRCSSLAARATRAMVGLNDLKPSPEAPAVSLYQYLSPVRRGQHA